MQETIFLAVLQGIAEFLPISSSGHLVIAQNLLNCGESGVRLEVCLHAGTLLSVVVFYRSAIARLLGGCILPGCDAQERRDAWSFAGKLFLSSLPAVAFYFCCGKFIDDFFDSAKLTGAMLIFTGFVLFSTKFARPGARNVRWLDALLMGAAQAVALIPGVSRSGMTLATAKYSGVDAGKSAEFSFLMSAPLIVGGLVLELAKAFSQAGGADGAVPAAEAVHRSWSELAIGGLVSAVVGYFALKILVATLKGRHFWLFGVYCIACGAFAIYKG